MKLGVSGKGGTGKTTLAGTLARIYARSGRQVLAIDADSNPNLATSLGVDATEAGRLRSLPKRAFDEGATLPQLLADFAVRGPDGIQLVMAARIEQAGSG